MNPQKTLKCLRCYHQWIRRKSEVRICPICKSPYWNRPRTVLHNFERQNKRLRAKLRKANQRILDLEESLRLSEIFNKSLWKGVTK